MASFNELTLDWSSIPEETKEWNYEHLQLAAELGKTLLERNKELENSLKQQQNTIDDQIQEIEYLTKQTAALREVNDSRLRIYEQLEVNIQDLERANHILAVENASNRKHIKTLKSNIGALETKCEQLHTTIDELTLQLDAEKRRAQKTIQERTTATTTTSTKYERSIEEDEIEDGDGLRRSRSPERQCTHTKTKRCVSETKPDKTQQTQTASTNDKDEDKKLEKEIEQISQLMSQIREMDTQRSRDHRRITELEEQLEITQEQNKILEKQLEQYHVKDEEIKSLHDEFNSLEEVRLGQLCSKCLGNVNGDSMSLETCDEDDLSMLDALNDQQQYRSSFYMEVQDYTKTSSPNAASSTPPKPNNSLYKDLVQKYQALLEVHRIPAKTRQPNNLSLQEELQMSNDFNNSSTKDTDEESGHGDSLKTENKKKSRKAFSGTPTDFSEAETSSSGFCDETCSNKATQTDETRLAPGSFLCTIGDGSDCIRIYDDSTAPIERRFRNRPEYRDLFKEIFQVLNKASKATTDADLILNDVDDEKEDATPKVPPATPSAEQLPDFPDNLTDDTQSVLSSTMSHDSSQQETTITENVPATPQKREEEQQQQQHQQIRREEEEPVLTPLVRQPLESIGCSGARKRSSSRKKKPYAERSDSPVTHIVGSPKVTYSNRHNPGRRRKENRPAAGNVSGGGGDVWKGNTAVFYNRNLASPTPSQDGNRNSKYERSAFEFKPSAASQELHRLKTLDRTYADVLRKSKGPWRRPN